MASTVAYSNLRLLTIQFKKIIVNKLRWWSILSENIKDVGARIREARKSKRLSQNELAEMINISPSHMSDIENGKKTIKLDILMRLTEALQVSADWLLRTDIPSVTSIHAQELATLLSDCTPSESQSLIKMLKEMKTAIRESGK